MKSERKSSTDRPSEPEPPRPAPVRREERAEGEAPAIDFARLDLRVEIIEERISPGETNVFDK